VGPISNSSAVILNFQISQGSAATQLRKMEISITYTLIFLGICQ